MERITDPLFDRLYDPVGEIIVQWGLTEMDSVVMPWPCISMAIGSRHQHHPDQIG